MIRLLGILLLIVAWPAAAQEHFVAGVPDLPLPPGMSEVPDATVIFDKPEGRIVEAWATGRVGREDVLGFYAATLPQLGWTAAEPDTYTREGESLRLHLDGGEAGLTLRISIAPR